MTDAFDERRKAQEESYFDKENKKKLEDLANKGKERLSPITGKPMVQEEIMGVTIDRCSDSGGIWLDAGELDELLNNSKKADEDNFFTKFLAGITK